MKYSIVIIMILSIAFTSQTVFAKSKIAFVDGQTIMELYSQKEKIPEKIAEEKLKRQEKVDDYKKDIEKLKKEYEMNAKLMSKKQREERESLIRKDIHKLQLKFQRYEKELQEIKIKLLKKLELKVKKAIDKIAKNKKLGIVLDKNAVFFGGYDISDDVCKILKINLVSTINKKRDEKLKELLAE